jgi:hypothetical protein
VCEEVVIENDTIGRKAEIWMWLQVGKTHP